MAGMKRERNISDWGAFAEKLVYEEMKSTFNRPLTPDETIDTFRNYINRLAEGKERDKIRIILK